MVTAFEWQTGALLLAVVLASGLQAATGIGFGVIAGPILLLILDSHTAIQISIILSLLIALALMPMVWRSIDWSLLRGLLLGTAVGLPFGIGVFLLADLYWLKFLAGLAVLWTGIFALRSGTSRSKTKARGKLRQTRPMPAQAPKLSLLIGSVSGVMSGSLAMPGPVVAAWMSAERYSKEAIRATILAMFLVSYAGALGLQAVTMGVTASTTHQTALLALPTLLGVAGGHMLARHLSEQVFRQILLVVLAATALSLFASSAPNLLARLFA